jgi:aspartate carbamoyltransferase catalytic subunit
LIPKYIETLGVRVSHNLDEALRWADVANMLRIQLERQDERYFPSIREYSKLFGLTMDRLNQANPNLLIMHPGPINRGVEISSEVADCSNSIILEQVENGVAIRMAVLFLLAQKSI